MKIAHLADIHLGYYAWRRLMGGFNVRGLDVSKAWQMTVADVIEWQPDLVLIAGDLFHTIRPSWHVFSLAVKGLRRLAEVAPVVVIGGNHDTPKTVETGSPIKALESACAGCREYVIAHPDKPYEGFLNGIWVRAVPFWSVANDGLPALQPAFPDPRPDRPRVLCAHIPMVPPGMTVGPPGSIPSDLLPLDQYDYVALGDYHDFKQVGTNACYAGGIERTTSNPWDEDPVKGWVKVTIEEKHVHVRHAPIPGRWMITVRATDAQLDDLKALRAEVPADAAETAVRVILPDRVDAAAKAAEVTKYLRDQVFHLKIVRTQTPRQALRVEVPRAAPRRSLEEELADVLLAQARETGLDSDRLLALGMKYLAEAAEQTSNREEP